MSVCTICGHRPHTCIEGAERWLPVVGFEGRYEVSDYGRVRSLLGRGRIMTQWRDAKRGGRFKVSLMLTDTSSRSLWVHRLVALAFLGPPAPDQEVAHWNGVATDNRLENLRWATRLENAADSKRLGTYSGQRSSNAKLTDDEALEVWRLCHTMSDGRIGRMLGVSMGAVRAIREGRGFVHLNLGPVVRPKLVSRHQPPLPPQAPIRDRLRDRDA
jgi:hypothetical protein